MDSLALRHLGCKTINYEDVCGKGAAQIGFDEVALDTRRRIRGGRRRHHAAPAPGAVSAGRPRREASTTSIAKSKCRHRVVLRKIERNGVLIDAELLREQSSELGARA